MTLRPREHVKNIDYLFANLILHFVSIRVNGLFGSRSKILHEFHHHQFHLFSSSFCSSVFLFLRMLCFENWFLIAYANLEHDWRYSTCTAANCVIHVWCSSLHGAAHLVHHFLFAACRFVIENDFCGLNEGSISIAWRFRNIPMFLSFRGVYQTDKWIRTEKIGALLKHISGAYICHHHYFLLLLLFHFNDSIKKYTNWKSNRF